MCLPKRHHLCRDHDPNTTTCAPTTAHVEHVVATTLTVQGRQLLRCKWFSVPKIQKGRRRTICCPQYLNKLCPIRELLVTNHIEDTVRQVRDAKSTSAVERTVTLDDEVCGCVAASPPHQAKEPCNLGSCCGRTQGPSDPLRLSRQTVA